MIKTFSVEDGTLVVIGEGFFLINNAKESEPIATTYEPIDKENVHQLPQSILYPTDEELAESKYPYMLDDYGEDGANGILYPKTYTGFNSIQRDKREVWVAGRKSVRGEFHLTREELKILLTAAAVWTTSFDDIISTIIHPTFPHTITVNINEDGNYNWNTLKCKY